MNNLSDSITEVQCLYFPESLNLFLQMPQIRFFESPILIAYARAQKLMTARAKQDFSTSCLYFGIPACLRLDLRSRYLKLGLTVLQTEIAGKE